MSAVHTTSTTARHALKKPSAWPPLRRYNATYAPPAIRNAMSKPSPASSKDVQFPPREPPQLSKPTRFQPPNLLNHHFEPYPKPINITTFQSTRSFLSDDSHPYYIKTQRKLKSFDPTILRWRVHVPTDVCKKAAVRDKVKKRMKHAFMTELRRRGYRKDGRVREDGAEGAALKGALLLVLPKDGKRALTFTDEEAKENVGYVLDQVVSKLRYLDTAKRPSPFGKPARPARLPAAGHRPYKQTNPWERSSKPG